MTAEEQDQYFRETEAENRHITASALTSDRTHLSASSLSRVTPKAREKAAERGEAMSDGSFPIRDAADLRRAIKAFGRAKDKGAAKRHIIRRARALGKVKLLPDEWRELASREFPGDPAATTQSDALTAAKRPSAATSLAAKAEKHNVPLAKLKVVYDRGLAEYATHPCVTAEQAAQARVNAYLLALSNQVPVPTKDTDLLPSDHPARERPFTGTSPTLRRLRF